MERINTKPISKEKISEQLLLLHIQLIEIKRQVVNSKNMDDEEKQAFLQKYINAIEMYTIVKYNVNRYHSFMILSEIFSNIFYFPNKILLGVLKMCVA